MTLAAVATVAFLCGLLQFFFNTILFPAVFAGKALRFGGFFLLKIGVYAVGLWLLFKVFKAFLIAGLSGFGAGFFLFLLVYAIAKLKKN